MKRKLLYLLLIVFVIIQFKRIDKEQPITDGRQDFFALTKVTPDVENILRKACYDCHSNETEYPWYSQLAPVSWWLAGHIDDGRSALNFSEWGSLSEEQRSHKVDECSDKVSAKEMPLLTYMIGHPDAWISQEERDKLVEFFNQSNP